MRMGLIVVAAVLSMTTLGCRNKGAQAEASGARRPAAPSAPARQYMPLDPKLVAQARQEIDASATSNDLLVRAHALEAMRQVYLTAYLPKFIQALRDPAPLIRKSAALAAGELQLKEALPALDQLVNDDDIQVRIAVRFAQHKLGDTSRSHDLEFYSQDSSKEARADTALVLGLLNEPSAINILRPLRRDREPTVRLQAAESMWRLGDEQALEELIAASVSYYVDDQMFAFSALATGKDPRVIEHLRVGLVSDYPEASLVAARAMGQLGSDAGYGVAQINATSKLPRQRALSAIAFGAIRRADAQPILSRLLHDGEPDVRLAAAVGILQLNPW